MKITLKDGSVKEFPEGVSGLDIAKSLSQQLGKKALVMRVDGVIMDIDAPITADATVEIFTFDDEEGKKALWHTASHVLAQAVKRLYPGVKLAIGPATDNGFYYDFDTETPFTNEDLAKIEKEMKKIVAENIAVERSVLSREEALKRAMDSGEIYKAELIEELPDGEEISFYTQGDFADLCAGPHVASTGKVRVPKLLKTAGAYWRGDEKNKMLQRIYGTAFLEQKDLDDYLTKLKEAEERDHNKLGRELGYFTTNAWVGQGLPLLMPKGAKTMQILQRFVEDEEERRGYQLTKTPYMAKRDLFEVSGHWAHYHDGMFIMGEGEDGEPLPGEEIIALRPMTCPFQFVIYNTDLHSYKELPIRYNETSTLFRNEASGEMHGLIRIRQFTLSEGHIICMPTQLEDEFASTIDLVKYVMKCLGIEDDITYRFSKWDPDDREKYIGDEKDWENAQGAMKKILDHIGLTYVEADGEAAFYGPKLDIQFKNVFGKEDTLFTIQVDFSLPERFDMTYVDSDGQKKRPIIIHRSSIGCYERTLAMLIEKYAGALPLWMMHEQVRLMSITDASVQYCKDYAKKLRKLGIRVSVDDRQEKIGYKIREARMQRIPYMLVAGEKEITDNTFAVRQRGKGEIGSLGQDEFTERVATQVEEKIIF